MHTTDSGAPSRRSVNGAILWSTPVVAAAIATPAVSASNDPSLYDLSLQFSAYNASPERFGAMMFQKGDQLRIDFSVSVVDGPRNDGRGYVDGVTVAFHHDGTTEDNREQIARLIVWDEARFVDPDAAAAAGWRMLSNRQLAYLPPLAIGEVSPVVSVIAIPTTRLPGETCEDDPCWPVWSGAQVANRPVTGIARFAGRDRSHNGSKNPRSPTNDQYQQGITLVPAGSSRMDVSWSVTSETGSEVLVGGRVQFEATITNLGPAPWLGTQACKLYYDFFLPPRMYVSDDYLRSESITSDAGWTKGWIYVSFLGPLAVGESTTFRETLRRPDAHIRPGEVVFRAPHPFGYYESGFYNYRRFDATTFLGTIEPQSNIALTFNSPS